MLSFIPNISSLFSNSKPKNNVRAMIPNNVPVSASNNVRAMIPNNVPVNASNNVRAMIPNNLPVYGPNNAFTSIAKNKTRRANRLRNLYAQTSKNNINREASRSAAYRMGHLNNWERIRKLSPNNQNKLRAANKYLNTRNNNRRTNSALNTFNIKRNLLKRASNNSLYVNKGSRYQKYAPMMMPYKDRLISKSIKIKH